MGENVYRCKICGKEIDEYQSTHYNQMCSECIRSSNIQKSSKSEISGKVVRLTSEIQSRKENHWTFFLFIWFIVAGFIAIGMGVGTGFGFFTLIGVGALIVGIFATIGMYLYIQKTRGLQEELKSITG